MHVVWPRPSIDPSTRRGQTDGADIYTRTVISVKETNSGASVVCVTLSLKVLCCVMTKPTSYSQVSNAPKDYYRFFSPLVVITREVFDRDVHSNELLIFFNNMSVLDSVCTPKNIPNTAPYACKPVRRQWNTNNLNGGTTFSGLIRCELVASYSAYLPLRRSGAHPPPPTATFSYIFLKHVAELTKLTFPRISLSSKSPRRIISARIRRGETKEGTTKGVELLTIASLLRSYSDIS